MALDRENISDSLLILLLVLAANAVSGAVAGLAAGDASAATCGDHGLSRAVCVRRPAEPWAS